MILQKFPSKAQRRGKPVMDELSWPLARLLCGFRFFDKRFLPNDDHDSRICDVESAPVVFHIKADLRAFRKADVPIDDGAANPRVPANIHMVVHDRVRDLTVAVDADIISDDAAL